MPSKEARRHNLESSIQKLKEIGLTNYETKNNGFAIIFREPHMPQVDYYPSTSKWRVDKETMHGDVVEFIEWYHAEKQKRTPKTTPLPPVTLELSTALEATYAAVRAMHDAVEDLAQIIITMHSENDGG